MTAAKPVPRPALRVVPTLADLTPAEKLVHDALLAIATFPDLGTGRPVSFTATARTLTAQVLAAAEETR